MRSEHKVGDPLYHPDFGFGCITRLADVYDWYKVQWSNMNGENMHQHHSIEVFKMNLNFKLDNP